MIFWSWIGFWMAGEDWWMFAAASGLGFVFLVLVVMPIGDATLL